MIKPLEYLISLQAAGALSFTTKQYARDLKLSAIAAQHSLHRLRRQKLIASPVAGFHVALTPGDRRLGCRPPEEFIDYLMQHLGEPYYVALLSAAEIHGAAHHRPQTFQVMVKKNRRPIKCGKVQIDFYAKSSLKDLPIIKHKVSTGYIAVSSPEFTALDLVGYQDSSGGLDNVATVLAELSTVMSPDKLAAASDLYPISWAQRLGFILELVNATELATALAPKIKSRANRPTPLLPGKSTEHASIQQPWRVIVNETLEPEL